MSVWVFWLWQHAKQDGSSIPRKSHSDISIGRSNYVIVLKKRPTLKFAVIGRDDEIEIGDRGSDTTNDFDKIAPLHTAFKEAT